MGITVLSNEFVAASVATLLMQNKKVLLGRRYSQNESAEKFSCWQCPGGYLKKGETIEQAAQRYCVQKAGIEIDCLSAGPYSNNIFSEQLHTTTLYVIATEYQVVNKQQFKNSKDDWQWFNICDLPEPLYLPLQHLPLEKIFSKNNAD